jgi:hypothetical protein
VHNRNGVPLDCVIQPVQLLWAISFGGAFLSDTCETGKAEGADASAFRKASSSRASS